MENKEYTKEEKVNIWILTNYENGEQFFYNFNPSKSRQKKDIGEGYSLDDTSLFKEKLTIRKEWKQINKK